MPSSTTTIPPGHDALAGISLRLNSTSRNTILRHKLHHTQQNAAIMPMSAYHTITRPHSVKPCSAQRRAGPGPRCPGIRTAECAAFSPPPRGTCVREHPSYDGRSRPQVLRVPASGYSLRRNCITTGRISEGTRKLKTTGLLLRLYLTDHFLYSPTPCLSSRANCRGPSSAPRVGSWN